MKKLMLSLVVAVIALTSATLFKPTTYKVDPTKSSFKWTGKKVTGSHWGYVSFSSGQVVVENKKITGGTFVMDMKSMSVQDIQGGMADKLAGHLKSDDFFSVEKNPTSTLALKSITPKSGNEYNVVANLTIKGITQEITFPATITMSGNELTAKANFNINRTKFDIKYRSGNFFENLGDKTIYDDFNVDVNVVATAEAPAKANNAKKASSASK